MKMLTGIILSVLEKLFGYLTRGIEYERTLSDILENHTITELLSLLSL